MRIIPATTAVTCCILAAWAVYAIRLSPAGEERPARQPPGISADLAARDADWFLDEMERLDRRIHDLESRVEDQSNRLAGLRQEQAGFEQRLADLWREAGQSDRSGAARIVILYKFKLLGYLTSMFSAADVRMAAENWSVAAYLLGNDQRLFLDLEKKGGEARRLASDIAANNREAGELKRLMVACSREIASAKEEKRSLLTRVNQQEDLYARYSSKLEESQKTLERRAFSRKPVFESRGMPFSSRQGRIPVPTAGDIVETFRSRTDGPSRTILYQNGIVITAARGQLVRAIHEGVVMFADWFKEYGKVMIIDHGEHYYSLIAHVEQFLKNTGDVVKAGETVATVGSTGSPSESRLYFEIRHYGTPVDPREWLALQ